MEYPTVSRCPATFQVWARVSCNSAASILEIQEVLGDMGRSRGIRGLCDEIRDVNSVPGSSIYIATAGFLLPLVALPILEAESGNVEQ